VNPLELWLRSEASLYVLECARIAGVVVAAPLAWLHAPYRVRAGLVLMLGFVVHGSSSPVSAAPDLLKTLVSLVSEFALGAAMGLVVRCMVAAAEVAADAIAPLLGLGVAHIFDSSSHSSENVLASLLRYGSVLIALLTGVHRVLLDALVRGFKVIPVGGVGVPGHALQVIWGLSASVLSVGVRLALPMIAVLFTVQVTLAFVSRAAPQLQIFSVGFAVAAVVGFAVLTLALPDMSRGMLVEFSRLSWHLEKLFGELGAAT
jgi:flagellar biosynthetic protein FliR